jgi:NAD(P)-dependent dehydrogenase (short-subunit alcohol dehydrogenase family)
MGLDGQRVVIIRGTSGIGLTSATAVARERAAVVIVSSNHYHVQDAVDQLSDGTEGLAVALPRLAAENAHAASLITAAGRAVLIKSSVSRNASSYKPPAARPEVDGARAPDGPEQS